MAKRASTIANTPKRMHEHRKMKVFYSQFVGHDDICFDVGANVGNRTKVFLDLGAKVVAVEPQPTCIARLRKKYGTNENVTIVPAAIGSKSGETRMMIGSENVASTLSKGWLEKVKGTPQMVNCRWDRSIEVSLTTLSQLIAEHGIPDFCKIDVEGFEEEVISGLSRPVKNLSFEFNSMFPKAPMNCIKILDGLGEYEFNYSLGESMKWALPKWTTGKDMRKTLSRLSGSSEVGDVYARLLNGKSALFRSRHTPALQPKTIKIA